MKMKDRKNAINKARRQSSNKINALESNRVYVFKSCVTNQYHSKGKYYTQAFGPEKGMNIAEKEVVAVYQYGKKIR